MTAAKVNDILRTFLICDTQIDAATDALLTVMDQSSAPGPARTHVFAVLTDLAADKIVQSVALELLLSWQMSHEDFIAEFRAEIRKEIERRRRIQTMRQWLLTPEL